MMNEKKCKECGITKSIENFYKLNVNKKSYTQGNCKICFSKKINAKYIRKKKEKITNDDYEKLRFNLKDCNNINEIIIKSGIDNKKINSLLKKKIIKTKKIYYIE